MVKTLARRFGISCLGGCADACRERGENGGEKMERKYALRLKRPEARIAQRAVLALIWFLVMTALCLLMYRYDNQYTAPGRQPKNGRLNLSTTEMDSATLIHLIDGWELFPNVMLTPQELQEHPDHYESIFVSVNERNIGHQPCGTYRLRLSLPQETRVYAMKIPLIYSAYRMYVDNDMVIQVGNPDEDHFKEALQERFIVFRGRGEVQLLLAYNNEGGTYRGMVYPPILGPFLTIYHVMETHLAFFGAAEIIIFLMLLLSIYLYAKGRMKQKLYTVLTHLFTMGFLSYPLIRGKLPLPQNPWRILELTCYFGCQLMLICAYVARYDWKDWLARMMKAAALAAFVISACTILFEPQINSEEFFHLALSLTRLLLWILVLDGMILTVRVICSDDDEQSTILTIGSVTMWVFMLVEMLTPSYHPILTGRIPEVGIVVLLLLLVLVEFRDIAGAYYFRTTYQERMKQTQKMLNMESVHYRQMDDQIKEIRRIRHDLRQQHRLIRSMLDQGQTEELLAYLEQSTQSEELALTQPLQFYNSPVVDAMLAYYWNWAKEYDTEFTVSGQLPLLPEVMCVDLCSLIGNMLENALEAIQRQDAGPRFIRISCGKERDYIMFQIQNSNTAPVRREEKRFYSAKRDDYGVGTLSIRVVAERYGGVADFSNLDGCFTARVMVPIHELTKAMQAEQKALGAQ